MPATKTATRTAGGNRTTGLSDIALSMKLPRKADFEKALIRQYGKAVQLSRKGGHRVSFSVVVDPEAGAQTISPVEEQRSGREDLFPVDEAGAPDDELRAALDAARERGRRRVAEVLAEDDMLSADAFAALLGVTRVTVNTRRQSGQLLGLDGAKRGFRFPSWQLDRDGRPYAALPILHERLGGAWAVYRFLVAPHGTLNGRTGLDALQRGLVDEALAAAESIARGEFR